MKIIKDALEQYCEEVKNKKFPYTTNAVKMDSKELKSLRKNIEDI